MKKYNIQFFDLEKGAPSATIAEYGITLNSAATKIIANYEYGKIGFDKNKKIVAIQPHNNDDELLSSFKVKERINNNGNYLRINSKDFVRVVTQHCSLSLQPSFRCLVEWDDEENLLIIDLKKILDSGKSDENGKRTVFKEGKQDE